MQTSASLAAHRRLRIHWFALRIVVTTLGLLTVVLFSSLVVSLLAQETPKPIKQEPAQIDLKSIKPDLVTPVMNEADPAPGRRVKQQLPEQRETKIYHALYLPTNWSADRRWPVLVEYPGNGPYANNLGDTNSGFVEDCNLAYGLPNHTDTWVLRDIEPRQAARAWLREQLSM